MIFSPEYDFFQQALTQQAEEGGAATTEGPTLSCRPNFGLIQVSGAQAATFLQGQLSCDVEALADGRSTPGCYCTVKGRMLSLFTLVRRGSEYYLFLPQSMISPTLAQLKKYGVFSKVTIADVSALWRHLVVSSVAGLPPAWPASSDHHFSATHPHYGYVDVFTSTANGETLLTSLRRHAVLLAPEQWQQQQLRGGECWIYPETTEQFTPQALAFEKTGGVCFTKGCYLGQEIVARLHYLGKAKFGPYYLQLLSHDALCLKPGMNIQTEAGQALGTVVEAARNAHAQSVDLIASLHHGLMATETFETLVIAEQSIAIIGKKSM